MRRRKNFGLCARMAWVLALVGTGTMAVAQTLLPDADGWYAWSVDARGDDQRCCFEWDGSDGRSTVCHLDGTRRGFGNQGHALNPTDSAVIYVKRVKGQVSQAMALSASCQVSAEAPIQHLPDMSVARSVAVLGGLIAADKSLADDALSALAAHEADAARAHILMLARTSEDAKIRSKAWFWLAQTRWAQTEAAAMTALQTDSSHVARQGAVFALAQLPGARSSEALIRVIETAALDQRDRKQALFWLAQDDHPRGLEYFSEILR